MPLWSMVTSARTTVPSPRLTDSAGANTRRNVLVTLHILRTVRPSKIIMLRQSLSRRSAGCYTQAPILLYSKRRGGCSSDACQWFQISEVRGDSALARQQSRVHTTVYVSLSAVATTTAPSCAHFIVHLDVTYEVLSLTDTTLTKYYCNTIE